jgi:S1-C subfamily serine protease
MGLVVIAASIGIYAGIQIASDDQPVATPVETTTTTEPVATTEPSPLVFTAEELAAEFGSAVWLVESFGCGELYTGTAFAIDEHHLVTNHHVVANSTRPNLVDRTGERVSGTVIGWSERPDLAIIAVDEPLDLWLEWAPTDELREGQPLVALGYPVPATDFTATPGSILSFQSRTGMREAIRTDAALDRGNSGGPALDSRGRVVGVVTEMAPNLGGFQLVPLIFTHSILADLIDEFTSAPSEPTVDCSGPGWSPVEPGAEDPETWSSDADTYGDHPMLDELWDLCEAGDYQSCDDLWYLSPVGSDYERFGDTCGDRNRPSGWCTEIYEQG